MSSFKSVNFSLRPGKTVQRRIAFEGVKRLQELLRLEDRLYIGLGSIYFTDFISAHKDLGIQDLVSIECNPIGAKRAHFNRPFKTVQVIEGLSTEILSDLADDETVNERPWVVWLDYDGALNDVVVEDLRLICERAPEDTLVLVTVNAHAGSYGRPEERNECLQNLLGDVVPEDMPEERFSHSPMPLTLSELALNYMKSCAAQIMRPGKFVPAFAIPYSDHTSMVTFGGFLPSEGSAQKVSDLVLGEGWPCWVGELIEVPPLTQKEFVTLQAQLPSSDSLTIDLLKELGFSLHESQLSSFEKYYLYYPIYIQAVS